MSEVKKTGRGGARPNSGRPKGSRNKKLIAREMATKNAIDETLSRLTEEEIERLTPLEIMILAMHLLLKSGNLMGAVSVAKEASPYVHGKVASMVPNEALPADLLPMPEAIGDDPDAPPAIEGDGLDDQRMAEYYHVRAERRRELEAGAALIE